MREKIEKFCENIKEEYCLYLYEKGEDIIFPYCCKLSADIITSYLKVICSDKFQYICTTREKAYNHAWTLYDDEKEKFIIDFTQLQYTNEKVARKMSEHKFANEDFKQIIKMEKVVFNIEETYMYECYNYMYPKEHKCHGIIRNFNGELCKEDFLAYLEKIYNTIFLKTQYY